MKTKVNIFHQNTLFLLFLLVSCAKTPSGPDIPDRIYPTIFCVIDPFTTTQRLLVQSTFSFSQVDQHLFQSQIEPPAHISLITNNQNYSAIKLGEESEKYPEDYHIGTDFLWGERAIQLHFSKVFYPTGTERSTFSN